MFRFVACATFVFLVLSCIPAAAGPVTLLSRADPDRPSDTAGGTSRLAAVSADGRYVVFLTNADNFLPGVTDTNAVMDVFFHDRIAGTTVLVSHVAADPSTAGNGDVWDADLSADGRWVAFQSTATDLIPGQVGDAMTFADIFLWDRDTGLTFLASHLPGLPTTEAGNCWGVFDISADGSRVAYTSSAPDLVTGQSEDTESPDAFLYDRATDTNVLVSHTSAGVTTAAGHTSEPFISADGNWVVFESDATNVVAGQTDSNGWTDLFLYDRVTGTNVLVSHAAGAASTAANNGSFSPRVSADGSRVAYESPATNLVTGQVDGNFDNDIFLYDRATGANTLVSHALSSATTAGNSFTSDPTLSADGRYVAFMGDASNLVSQPTGFWLAVYLYDRVTGTNSLVSRGSATPSGDSSRPRISSDGAWVGFLSDATNLVPGQTDTIFTNDVFLWSRVSGSLTLVTRAPGSATTTAGSSATNLAINADGSWIALVTPSSGLVGGLDDHNGTEDVYLYERATGVNTLLTSRGGAVSASAGGALATWSGTAMSNDGRFVAFTSAASNLAGAADGNMEDDVFLYDRVTSAITLVSHASGAFSTAGNSSSSEPLLSTDGSVVVFRSDATNLVPGQAAPFFPRLQLFLYDRAGGGILLVSRSAGSPSTPANGAVGFTGDYAASGDGRWIAFTHYGTDLVAGQVDGNGTNDVFLFDRATGTTLLVSHTSSSPTQAGNGFSSAPSLSADGRYLAFRSNSSDLVPGQGGTGGLFLYDRVAGTTTRVIYSGDTLRLSADGRWLVFNSGATDVVPGQVDTNSASDVFLWDRVSGATQLVSHTPASPVTAGDARSRLGNITYTPPVISADGRWVVFSSEAHDLVTGPSGIDENVFLFDRIAGTVALVSRAADWPTGDVSGSSIEPNLSADGRFITYLSQADNLVPGQVDGWLSWDVFLHDRITAATSLVSHIPASEVTSGTPANGFLLSPRISADGSWAAFSSASPDLTVGDHDGVTDAFLHGRPFGRDFFVLSPCRILDTRLAGQGPALSSGVKRTLAAHGTCGIPATARALAVNVTVVQPSAAGFLTFHAGDLAPETVSTINFGSGQLRSNNAILPLSFDGRGLLAVTPLVGGNGTVHLIVDVSGWFE